MPIRLFRNGRASRLNQQGNDWADQGQDAQALAAYAQAARAQPRWATPWFNMGLVHKYRGEWAASLHANQQALMREPAHEGALWNAGIAATALGQWPVARQMWQRYGIALANGDGPPAFAAPALTPIRVNPRAAPEVLWADRIDPARAIIRSIPTPDAQRRYGDCLLHDGAPNGWRRHNGQDLAVLDELQVLQPSAYSTWELRLTGLPPEDAPALVQRLVDADLPAEDWSAGLRLLCRACSEGRPDEHPGHTHPPQAAEPPGTHRLGLALLDPPAQIPLLQALLAAHAGAQVQQLRCLWPPANHPPPAAP